MANKKQPVRAKSARPQSRSSKKKQGLFSRIFSSRKATVLVFVGLFGLVGAGFLFASQAASTTKTLTFTPTHDTFVTELAPSEGRNDFTELRAANGHGPCSSNTCVTNDRITYLKFYIKGVPADYTDIDSVKLKLYTTNGGADGGKVYRAKSASWDETSLTYENQPGYDPAKVLGNLGSVTKDNWREITLTKSSVNGVERGAVAFAIASNDADMVAYATRETANKPTLTVTYKVPDTTTPPPSTLTPRFPGDPKPGTMYYGSSFEGGNIATFEQANGVKVGLYRSYMQSSSPTSKFVSQASDDISNNRIPLMSTKLPGTWTEVADGKYDAWLLERIKALAALPGPVWLSLHHEPRNDGEPAEWARMQQHARKLIDANSKNIALVGILNGYDFKVKNGNPEAYNHPVGTGVHVMGFDSYNPWFPGGNQDWKDVNYVFSPGPTIMTKWGYPTLVGEYGVREDKNNPGKAAQWMRDAYTFGLTNKFVAISYFNSGANSPDGPWTLDGERLQVFKENLAKTTTARAK